MKDVHCITLIYNHLQRKLAAGCCIQFTMLAIKNDSLLFGWWNICTVLGIVRISLCRFICLTKHNALYVYLCDSVSCTPHRSPPPPSLPSLSRSLHSLLTLSLITYKFKWMLRPYTFNMQMLHQFTDSACIIINVIYSMVAHLSIEDTHIRRDLEFLPTDNNFAPLHGVDVITQNPSIIYTKFGEVHTHTDTHKFNTIYL